MSEKKKKKGEKGRGAKQKFWRLNRTLFSFYERSKKTRKRRQSGCKIERENSKKKGPEKIPSKSNVLVRKEGPEKKRARGGSIILAGGAADDGRHQKGPGPGTKICGWKGGFTESKQR